MRSFKAKARKTTNEIAATLTFGAVLAVVGFMSMIPQQFYYFFVGAASVGFILWLGFKFKKPEKYINAEGYVVLTATNELEHRSIAIQLVGRGLERNEVVHHINGNKTDNKVNNLCLMDREKHEFFHSWLRWKKEKSGKYPPLGDQKRVLENEYGGTLLEKITTLKIESRTPQNLFEVLRRERKRLATAKDVPAYMVFDDKTLLEMAEIMPESESAMLQIRGVGPIKIQMYGSVFISAIKKYKKEYSTENRRDSDTA